MQKYIVLLLLGTSLFSQEKSQIIHKNETVTIKNKNNLEIESFASEKRWIAKSKNQYEYTISLPYDSFKEISNIKGSTTVQKTKRKHTLFPNRIIEFDADQEHIFKSDIKIKQFEMPSVEDNSIIEFSYKTKLKQPRFLSPFRFQSPVKTQSCTLTVHCDANIELGYIIFGDHQDKIKFTKTTSGNVDTYTWVGTEIPGFESEEKMPSTLKFQPHIIYYIKKYNQNGVNIELLNSTKNLYDWYHSLVKNINKADQTNLKNTTLELIKDKTTDLEKAQTIYYWAQKNLHYVAFEDGMGGFIPREAADVYSKLYGDCKDMSNILNEMFKYANLNSNLTWIGTRLKPYTYQDVPTPLVDNHMITHLKIDRKDYFIDATDKFCPFPMPTAMIQGKEAMISQLDEFQIIKVPVIAAHENKKTIKIDLNIDGNSLKGKASTSLNGYEKSDLLNFLSNYSHKQNEIWKNVVNYSNPKIILEPITLSKNEYQSKPAVAEFNLQLEDVVKNVNGKLLLKPIFIFPLKDDQIDVEKRQYPVENNYQYLHEIEYQYEIPTDYKVEFIPENVKTESDFATFDIQYKVQNNVILVSQKIEYKALLLEKKEFEQWNSFIKSLNKTYNQSLILSK